MSCGFAIRLSLGLGLASAEGGLQIRSSILPDYKSGRALSPPKRWVFSLPFRAEGLNFWSLVIRLWSLVIENWHLIKGDGLLLLGMAAPVLPLGGIGIIAAFEGLAPEIGRTFEVGPAV